MYDISIKIMILVYFVVGYTFRVRILFGFNIVQLFGGGGMGVGGWGELLKYCTVDLKR